MYQTRVQTTWYLKCIITYAFTFFKQQNLHQICTDLCLQYFVSVKSHNVLNRRTRYLSKHTLWENQQIPEHDNFTFQTYDWYWPTSTSIVLQAFFSEIRLVLCQQIYHVIYLERMNDEIKNVSICRLRWNFKEQNPQK